MAEHDVVVMPSTNTYWQELFGIVSVEAQHAGCRVVASKSGGLPETNVGGQILVAPDDALSLAKGMAKAIQLGPLTKAERAAAASQFTVEQSVDALLKAIGVPESDQPQTLPLRGQPALFHHFQPLLSIGKQGSKYATQPLRSAGGKSDRIR
jgi:D-inositol-3-phosphate glycosyltransferase